MILQAGDPNLRKVQGFDSDIGSPSFCRDLECLIRVLKEEGGMGIAAPQLGIERRLLLIESKPNSRYPFAPQIDLMVLANPEIIKSSPDKEYGWEGCLSVPNKRVKVGRAKSVLVKYSDRIGQSRTVDLHGFAARVFLHEYDHLEGLTILDRAESEVDIISEEEYFQEILPGLE